jgi:hypothetical protein
MRAVQTKWLADMFRPNYRHLTESKHLTYKDTNMTLKDIRSFPKITDSPISEVLFLKNI